MKLYPSLKKLSLSSGCNVKQITRALNELVEKKYITKLRVVGKVNHYRFTDNFFEKIGIKEKLSAVNLTDDKKTVLQVSFCKKIVSFCKNLLSKSQTNMALHDSNNSKFFKKNYAGDNQKEFLEKQKRTEKRNKEESEKRKTELEKWRKERNENPIPPEFFEQQRKKLGIK